MRTGDWVLSAVLSVDFLLILSVPVRLSATSLSEIALCGQTPCTLSAIVGPASQTELSASDALALCVLWHGACLVETGFLFFPFSMMLVFPFWFYHVFFLLFSGFDLLLVPLFIFLLVSTPAVFLGLSLCPLFFFLP